MQSKDSLERLNQTLKSLLRFYWTEPGCDWEEWVAGTPVRGPEVQESKGFSPHDLPFGHQETRVHSLSIFRLVNRFWFYNRLALPL